MGRNPRTYDVTWFLDLHEKGQLDLDPTYQRRSVWTPKDRRYFVDTVMSQFPAPPVFLHKTYDERGRATYHVVDGKQRLKTIIDFSENRIRIPDTIGDIGLRGFWFKDLEQEVKQGFWNYEIVVEMLPDVSPALVREIFERINRNSRKLNSQELRHAKYDGWFVSLAESEADSSEWRTLGVASAARSNRMADVQFISELLLVTIEGKPRGFSQDVLDNRYADLDDIEDIRERGLLDEESFRSLFDETKRLALDALTSHPELLKIFRVNAHFYSFWCFLTYCVSSDVPVSISLWDDYAAFIGDVVRVSSLDEQEGGFEMGVLAPIKKYANNARGASTEFPQRQARLEALLSLVEGTVSENREVD